MIFGHYFYFQNELFLQREFHKQFSDASSYPINNTITVAELEDHAVVNSLFIKTEWCSMSGQVARYYSAVPFEESDENFSWGLEIKDIMTLVWDAPKHRILYVKGKDYTPHKLRFWIYHTFFPLVLEMQRKYRMLHVGSVEIEGGAILFSAFSYGGKSTLTDFFVEKGHTLLSDDSLAIEKRDDHYYGIPSYPFYRPYRGTETLGFPVDNFAIEPKLLRAIFILEKCKPDAVVEIIELNGVEKFKEIYYSSFIDFAFMKKERFDYFTEMVKYIPLYRITIPWNMDRLIDVYEIILNHLDRHKKV